jgi:hypothetical protein
LADNPLMRIIGMPLAALVVFALALVPVLHGQARISVQQATPVLRALETVLPPALRGRRDGDLAARWSTWVEQHDREVRARLSLGDEDSLVNFWLYGTTFTTQPPAVARGSAVPAATLEAIVGRRLEDLLDGLSAPGENERLQFARSALLTRDANLGTAAGRERARRLLSDARQRMVREFAETDRTLADVSGSDAGARAAANATIFRERGLSSDTSVLANYGVQVALESIARYRTLAPRSVRRVAVVGPGLDFTNKSDGYDFYPEQTIQPFAVIDSLRRAGLAAPDLSLTTIDISGRVNAHLRNAPLRAASNAGYVVTLPLDAGEAWTGELMTYWQRWGSDIGSEVRTITPPAAAGNVKARAVRIQPAVVSSLSPLDANIVVDRLLLPDDERFDLIVATNVLLYYDVFEQALASSNAAAMLRPGGVFLTNTAVFPTPPLQASASYLRVTHTPQRYDEMYWYVRDK